MATFAPALAQLASACEPEGLTADNSEKIAAELARIFHVKKAEVGIMRVEEDALVFVYPHKLQPWCVSNRVTKRRMGAGRR